MKKWSFRAPTTFFATTSHLCVCWFALVGAAFGHDVDVMVVSLLLEPNFSSCLVGVSIIDP